MTVAELIAALQKFPPDEEIIAIARCETSMGVISAGGGIHTLVNDEFNGITILAGDVER